VIFTVIVDFEGSGKTSSLNPLSNRYSVIPSTDVTFVTSAGNGAIRKKSETIAKTKAEFFNRWPPLA
jgi:thymidylate kinase